MTTRDHPTTVDGALRALDRLVGRWTVSGEATGEVRFEWLEGGHFLLQHVDLVQSGFRTRGLEVIGRERPFGAPQPGPDICSRYYDDHGNTLDYVYELEDDVLTIWGGERGSPAYFRGTFIADGSRLDGGWTYPDGGGYRATLTRAA